MLFQKKKPQLTDIVRDELTEAYVTSESEEQKEAIWNAWKDVDKQALEREKLRADHAIDAKTVFTSGVTVLLAGATLAFECSDTLRSKVTNLWLRRK